MTITTGRRNAVSRIIGQKKMFAFLKRMAPKLPEEAFDLAKQYIHHRKRSIEKAFLKYLSDDKSDKAYKKLLASLDESRIVKKKSFFR